MRKRDLWLACCLLWGTAYAQQMTPGDPGMKTAPDPGMKSPSNSGRIVVPPKVDPGAVEKPPAQVDPKIDDATGAIDQKNRTQSQDKPRKKDK